MANALLILAWPTIGLCLNRTLIIILVTTSAKNVSAVVYQSPVGW